MRWTVHAACPDGPHHLVWSWSTFLLYVHKKNRHELEYARKAWSDTLAHAFSLVTATLTTCKTLHPPPPPLHLTWAEISTCPLYHCLFSMLIPHWPLPAVRDLTRVGRLSTNNESVHKLSKVSFRGKCTRTGHLLKLPSPTKLARLGHFPPASFAGRLAGPVFYIKSFLCFCLPAYLHLYMFWLGCAVVELQDDEGECLHLQHLLVAVRAQHLDIPWIQSIFWLCLLSVHIDNIKDLSSEGYKHLSLVLAVSMSSHIHGCIARAISGTVGDLSMKVKKI